MMGINTFLIRDGKTRTKLNHASNNKIIAMLRVILIYCQIIEHALFITKLPKK